MDNILSRVLYLHAVSLLFSKERTEKTPRKALGDLAFIAWPGENSQGSDA